MLPTIISIIMFLTVIVLWCVSTQQRLVMFDENVGNAMIQIGVQLCGRFEALIALLNVVKSYSVEGGEELIETVNSSRSLVTAKSRPTEIILQDRVISKTLSRINLMTEQYPALREDSNYINLLNAVDTFENMLCTSCLIYNDSVIKLNRLIRTFPTFILARIFGISCKEYLELCENK